MEMRKAAKARDDAINTSTALREDPQIRELLIANSESLQSTERLYEQSWRHLIDAERELVEFAKQREGDAAPGNRLLDRIHAANREVEVAMALLLIGASPF